MKDLKKILVVRFSSIGDIVLTSPILRCIKQHYPNTELHYLTKTSFESIVQHNPYVNKVYTIDKDLKECIKSLKKENYDLIIDLHHNLRTLQLKLALRKPSHSFPKLNFEKWMLVNFKLHEINITHVVDRYFETVHSSGIKYDGKGLDYFISPVDEINIAHTFNVTQPYIAFVIGAKFATKALTVEKIIAACKLIQHPIILLGGKEDQPKGNQIAKACSNTVNGCGQLSLNQSASVLKQAYKVITHDTGLMHIAAAYHKDLTVIWGSTVPQLGFSPYLPSDKGSVTNIEVLNLKCRPCSKIGYQHCPKKHFRCINDIDTESFATI